MKKECGLKRGVLYLCILFIIALCMSATLVSALTLSIKPLSGSEEVVMGEEFEVSIWVDQNITNIVEYFYDLNIVYNQDDLACTGIVFNGILHDPNDLIFSVDLTYIAWNPWSSEAPYGLRVSVMSIDNQFLAAGELFRIRFNALKEGTTILSLNNTAPQEEGIFVGATFPLPYTYEVEAPSIPDVPHDQPTYRSIAANQASYFSGNLRNFLFFANNPYAMQYSLPLYPLWQALRAPGYYMNVQQSANQASYFSGNLRNFLFFANNPYALQYSLPLYSLWQRFRVPGYHVQ